MAGGEKRSISVQCTGGTWATGGGYDTARGGAPTFMASRPTAADGGSVIDFANAAGARIITVGAYAVCSGCADHRDCTLTVERRSAAAAARGSTYDGAESAGTAAAGVTPAAPAAVGSGCAVSDAPPTDPNAEARVRDADPGFATAVLATTC